MNRCITTESMVSVFTPAFDKRCADLGSSSSVTERDGEVDLESDEILLASLQLLQKQQYSRCQIDRLPEHLCLPSYGKLWSNQD